MAVGRAEGGWLRLAQAGYVQQGVRVGPLVCMRVARLLPLQWGGFSSEPGGPQRSGCYTATQSGWEGGSWWEEPGGPFLSLGKSNFLRQDYPWDMGAWMCTRDSGLEWWWAAPSQRGYFLQWVVPKKRLIWGVSRGSLDQSEVHAFLVIYQTCALRDEPQLRATSRRYYAWHVYVGFDFGGSVLQDAGFFLPLLPSCREKEAKVEVWLSFLYRQRKMLWISLLASFSPSWIQEKCCWKKGFKQLEFHNVQFLVPAFVLCRKWHQAHFLWKGMQFYFAVLQA